MRARFVPLAWGIAIITLHTPVEPHAASSQDDQASPAEPTPARVPLTRYTIAAGDVTGDGVAEAIVHDTASKALRVIDYAGPAPVQTMGIFVRDDVVEMQAADLDGDGRAEVITGEGLRGYNTKGAPPVDVSIKIYKPVEKGDWTPVEIYRHASERPEVTSLQIEDFDGDGRQDILFAYFESKYVVDIRLAKQSNGAWAVSELPTIRMGAHVAAGDVLHNGRWAVVVGRPYGDPPDVRTTTAIGDAFVLDGERRIPLPVTRGVSAVTVGDVDGDKKPDIVVADGWHANYGKLARCRIAVVSREGDRWKYELIEDLADHIRFERVDVVDLTGDGRPEIVGRAARDGTLGGSVRVYQRTRSGWRGMTAGRLAQAYAFGDFDGDRSLELVFAGQPPLPFSLASSAAPRWETSLGEAVETPEVDPESLVGKPAPALKATEWVDAKPLTLAALKGKVVMLDFWATWCQPCIAMYPEMRQWVEQFGPRGFVVIGITNHSRQTSADVRRFLARHKLPWPVAIDPKNRTHIDYGVSPIPHTFLIDRKGIVRLSHRGGGDLTKIKATLQALLAEPPPSADRP
ncbi:MAG TPA: redoxin domain-containing protein [Vicinamibacterales bacterium]|nr:redoxin domain-containing protein [Vicinamibacterales bacterium]